MDNALNNDFLTVHDYAEARGKSMQAVYKQMKGKANAAALEGHVVTRKVRGKNVRMLDAVAVGILDDSARQSPQVILQTDNSERLQQLEDENKRLLIRIAELQDALISSKTQVEQLQADKIQLLETAAQQPERQYWWQRLFKS